MDQYQNYRTTNPDLTAGGKDWCISTRLMKTIKQATVSSGKGKPVIFASRFPVSEGDVAVAGNSFVCSAEFLASPTDKTGLMGIVTGTASKLEIRRTEATELNFVFSAHANKTAIKDCIDYLDAKADTDTLLYHFQNFIMYPITYRIRKIMAAASILSHKDLADASAVNKAKDYLMSPQIIGEEIGGITRFIEDEYPGIDFCDIQVDIEGKNEDELSSLISDGLLECDDRYDANIDPLMDQYVNKYSYIGAVSVMVRGGFNNLLRAFLSVDPPIKAFFDELLRDIGDCGQPATLEILRQYTPKN